MHVYVCIFNTYTSYAYGCRIISSKHPSGLLRHFRRDVKQRVAHAEDHRHDCGALVSLSEANVRSLGKSEPQKMQKG